MDKKITDDFIEKILSKGVRDMPTNPAAQGYDERQIRAFYYLPEKQILIALSDIEDSIIKISSEIKEGVELGETEGTAYEGHKGKQNADNIAKIQSGKLDKITTEDSLKRAYTINTDGTQSTTRCSINPMGGALPIYDGANLRVGENPTHNAHATSKKYVDNKFNGANKALSFGDYSTMISSFNALPNDTYNIGQNVMVVTLEVPDLWISGIVETEEEKVEYTYTSDEEFITALTENGYVQVGYYKLSALETQKVDLTHYNDQLNDLITGVQDVETIQTQQRELIDELNTNKVGFEDYPTDTRAGVLKVGGGLSNNFGTVIINPAMDYQIEAFNGYYSPVCANKIPLAVKAGLANSTLEWTEEEKANARELLGVSSSGGSGKLYRHLINVNAFNDNGEVVKDGEKLYDIAHWTFSFISSDSRQIFELLDGYGDGKSIDLNEIAQFTFADDMDDEYNTTHKKTCIVTQIKCENATIGLTFVYEGETYTTRESYYSDNTVVEV